MGKTDQPANRQPPPGKALLISPERAAKLMALLDRIDLEPDPVQFQQYTRAGKVFFRLRDQAVTGSGGGGGGGAPLYATVGTVPDSDPVAYHFTVSPGYLEYQNAGAADFPLGPAGYLVPTMGGVSLEDAENLQPLPLPGLVSYLYLRVKTDADGVPKAADGGGYQVTIEVFDEEKKSTHHVRPSPSGGEEEGDYFILLAQTESDGGTPAAPRIVRRLTGNRSMPNQLVEITNLGDGRELYDGYDPGPEDKHKFRSLKQLEDGEEYEAPVMAPLPEGASGEGDTINFLGLGVLQPESGGSRRPANFELGADKKVTKLNFTGVDGPINIPLGGGVLNFAGGLCIGGAGNGDPGDGEGLWGQIGWQYAPPVGSIQSMILFVENGIIKSVTNTQGIIGSGTQADPIFTNFQTG